MERPPDWRSDERWRSCRVCGRFTRSPFKVYCDDRYCVEYREYFREQEREEIL